MSRASVHASPRSNTTTLHDTVGKKELYNYKLCDQWIGSMYTSCTV